MVKSRLEAMLWLDIGVCTHFELFCDGIRIRVFNETNRGQRVPAIDVALSDPFPECVVKFLEI